MASQSPVPKKVLVFGATGLIGKFILQALVDKKSFEKIGIFTSQETAERKKETLDRVRDEGVEVVVGDVNKEADVAKAYGGFDTVVSALGRNVILTQISLLDIAEASPTIHTFYPSEYGTDIEYAPSSATEKPHQLKLQVRKHIRENIKELNVTYLVTGPYSDLYLGKLPGKAGEVGSFDPKEKKAVLLGSGDDRVSFTTMKDVGKLLVAALKTEAKESPRALIVNSFTTTPHEILKEFEKQTDAKWDVSYTTLTILRKSEKEALDGGDPLATMYTLRRIWTEGGTLYESRDNGKIGEPKTETLEEQVKNAVEKEVAGFQSGIL
ncbi:putative isoflavone reductase family protein [Massarina eburnea CBS 473.64]|uniref:Putative isoflavone reductase family protein n=1 Tax=Massarina eburnea CBS 473.64 TaxID=1395130 RepID=A0A6A6S583_9PLEO|nr:putative isoflavone reductase family protein [Massarina eburnea CBS 473.64]